MWRTSTSSSSLIPELLPLWSFDQCSRPSYPVIYNVEVRSAGEQHNKCSTAESVSTFCRTWSEELQQILYEVSLSPPARIIHEIRHHRDEMTPVDEGILVADRSQRRVASASLRTSPRNRGVLSPSITEGLISSLQFLRRENRSTVTPQRRRQENNHADALPELPKEEHLDLIQRRILFRLRPHYKAGKLYFLI